MKLLFLLGFVPDFSLSLFTDIIDAIPRFAEVDSEEKRLIFQKVLLSLHADVGTAFLFSLEGEFVNNSFLQKCSLL